MSKHKYRTKHKLSLQKIFKQLPNIYDGRLPKGEFNLSNDCIDKYYYKDDNDLIQDTLRGSRKIRSHKSYPLKDGTVQPHTFIKHTIMKIIMGYYKLNKGHITNLHSNLHKKHDI